MNDLDRHSVSTAEAAEYEAARGTALLVPRTDRAFLRVFGREPVKMVQGLITNDLSLASATRAVYAGMLTPKGKLVAEMRVLVLNQDVLLETALAAKQSVIDHLKKYVPPLFARAEDVSSNYTMVGVYGPQAPQVVQPLMDSQSLPEREDEMISADQRVCIRSSYTIEGGFELIAPGSAAFDGLPSLTPGGLETLEVLRIEAGQPRWGADLDENVIPLEAGLRARMISQNKGCYTGQEVIVRILHRGHVNWQLRGLRLGQLPAPERGTQLHNSDGKAIARVTSATFSPRFGETIGLGYVRREVMTPAVAKLKDTDVQIVELPFL
jgi:folate-binding protein YgfZ